MLADMRVLVRNWRADCGWDQQVTDGIASNLLGKGTRARASDVYRRTFSQRFIKGEPPEAWRLVRPLEDHNVGLDILKPVYYWITARSDALLYDFVELFITERSRSVELVLSVDDASRWIKNTLSRQRQGWSPTVTLKVARGLLAALRDFGILEGTTKKRIAPVYLPIESFAYLAFLINQLGWSGAALINHSDWRLFLMSPPLVERLFLEAHQRGFLCYDAAGNLYRIEFHASTAEEMADVITRRTN